MKTFFIGLGCLIGFLALILVLTFAGNGIEFINFKFWAPKTENVKRKVFENTQSYVEGKRQDLSNYHHQWVVAKDPVEKGAIESVVRQQFSNVGSDVIIDQDLYQWMRDCQTK